MKQILFFFMTFISIACFQIISALASCRVNNQTKYSFTVESGNTSNQSVGSNTSTTIAAGKIIGKSADGKSVSGSCKDGDELVIKEEKGVAILMPKK